MASNTFHSRLTPHVEDIIRNHQCGSDDKGSNNDWMHSIC